MIFVDTSAFYAASDKRDQHHAEAVAAFRKLARSGPPILTTSFVIVETAALLERRLGRTVAQSFLGDISEFIVVGVDQDLLESAVSAYVGAGGSTGPSLVDCTSFEAMRARRINEHLGFDKHFDQQGFKKFTG